MYLILCITFIIKIYFLKIILNIYYINNYYNILHESSCEELSFFQRGKRKWDRNNKKKKDISKVSLNKKDNKNNDKNKKLRSRIFTNEEILNPYEVEINDEIINFLEITTQIDGSGYSVLFKNFFPLLCNRKILIEYTKRSIENSNINHNYMTFRPIRNAKHCNLILSNIDESIYDGIDLSNLFINKEDNIYTIKDVNLDVLYQTKSTSETEALLKFLCKEIIGMKGVNKLIKKMKIFDSLYNDLPYVGFVNDWQMNYFYLYEYDGIIRKTEYLYKKYKEEKKIIKRIKLNRKDAD